LEQFNDILFQENLLSCDADSPLFELGALEAIKSRRSMSPEAIKVGLSLSKIRQRQIKLDNDRYCLSSA